MDPGHTLLELVGVLLLLALTTAAVLPPARRAADRAAVVGAREAMVGAFSRARDEARAEGGARLHVAPAQGRIWVEAAGAVRGTVDLAADFGVRLKVAGDPAEVTLMFDGLGVGRRASRTFRLERGAASASLVVAAYGRVERR